MRGRQVRPLSQSGIALPHKHWTTEGVYEPGNVVCDYKLRTSVFGASVPIIVSAGRR